MICDYCQNSLNLVPKEFLLSENVPIIKSGLKQQFIDEYVKLSSEFDLYLFEHRAEDLAEQRRQETVMLTHGKAVLEGHDKGNEFGVECPYCHATNIRKISATSRVASTLMFGLGSKKIGKQWHCDKCGSDF